MCQLLQFNRNAINKNWFIESTRHSVEHWDHGAASVAAVTANRKVYYGKARYGSTRAMHCDSLSSWNRTPFEIYKLFSWRIILAMRQTAHLSHSKAIFSSFSMNFSFVLFSASAVGWHFTRPACFTSSSILCFSVVEKMPSQSSERLAVSEDSKKNE